MMIKNKKILITGADGFIGSHLTEMLFNQGAQIRALSQYNAFNHWGWLEDIKCKNEIEIITGDIRDPHFCNSLLKNIDIVFHLAALIAIPYSYRSPQSYFETNVSGTMNICQAALDNSIQRLIHTSTSEVYGSALYVPIDEKHLFQAQSPYSASKIGADAVVESFYRSFNLPMIIARPFNTYGPRQSARAIIPTIITQIAGNNEKIKLGDLKPTRDFTFVEDLCKGLIALSECDSAVGETLNLGSNTEISIIELFLKIREIMKSNAEIIDDKQRLRPEKSEVMRLVCDNSKIKNMTGFAPETSLDDGLKKTIAWFKDSANLAKYKGDLYNV